LTVQFEERRVKERHTYIEESDKTGSVPHSPLLGVAAVLFSSRIVSRPSSTFGCPLFFRASSGRKRRDKKKAMAYQIMGIAIVAALYVLVRFLHATDIPKIKGIPEIPGVPIFGNLIALGTNHARVAQRWAKEYGPVFQARLGNRVGLYIYIYICILFVFFLYFF